MTRTSITSLTAPEPGETHYAITEEAECRFWKTRHLLNTLSFICLRREGEAEIPAESLSITFNLIHDLLDIPMAYVVKSKKE
jgi:hypothetical protein